jgi:hypothetical protein
MVALAKPTDFGLDNSLTFVAVVLNACFGAALVARLHVTGETVHGSVGAVPLTVTVLALSAGAITFRRMVRDYRRAFDVIADAARAAVLFALALTVIALFFRADSREFGQGWGNQLAHLFDVRIAYGPSIPGSFFAGFVSLFVTLVGVGWVRRDLWPERRRQLSEVLVPPLYGLGAFAVMLPLAGLIGVILILVSGHTLQDLYPTSHHFATSATLIFGVLASGGYWLINVGAGGSVGEHGDDGGSSSSEYHHLGFFAGHDHGLWAAPLVMLVVVALATIVVARRTRTREALQASLLTWVGLLLVSTPLLVWLTSGHASISASDEEASGAVGVNGWLAALLLPAVALVCSAVVAHSRGAVDLSRLRAVGQGLQSDPGRPPSDDS